MDSTTIQPAPRSTASLRDDRVLLETRFAAGLVVLVLVLAVWVLYFLPDSTDQYFAWTITPRMTPLAMGAGYAMGAYFFTRVMLSKRWHHAALGFLPITAFTILMLLATWLHWDRFHQGTIAFALWFVVYAITPFIVPIIWLRNRNTDPGTREADEVAVPSVVRRAALVGGIIVTLFATADFIFPQLAIRIWPWQLTPLTARVLAGWLMLPGVGGIVLSNETRWSGGWRLMVESMCVGAFLFFIGVVRAWSDWQFANPLSVVVVVALAMLSLLLIGLYAWMLRHQSAGRAPS